MRNDGAARVGSIGPPYSISKTIDNYSSDIYRYIIITIFIIIKDYIGIIIVFVYHYYHTVCY